MNLGPWLVATLLDALGRDIALARVVALAVYAFRDPGDLEGLPAWVWRGPSARCPALELIHVDSEYAHLISLLVIVIGYLFCHILTRASTEKYTL